MHASQMGFSDWCIALCRQDLAAAPRCTCMLVQDIQSLLQDLPGVDTSSNVSFGLKQMVPQSTSLQPSDKQSVVSYYSSGHDVSQHMSQPPQPFSQIFGTTHDMQLSPDTKQERLFCFRQLTVRNNTPVDVRLIDVRFSPNLPLWPNTMALTDDVGISAVVRDTDLDSKFRSLAVSSSAAENVAGMPDQQDLQRSRKPKVSKKQRQLQAQRQQLQAQKQQPQAQRQQLQQPQQQQQSVQNEPKRESQQHQQQAGQQLQSKPQLAGDSSNLQSGEAEDKHQEGVQCVKLHAGQEYPVTVMLNCLDGPHRK